MDSRKKQICHDFQLGKCENLFNCPFSHMFAPKTKGECEYGKMCSKKHNETDCEYFIKGIECPRGVTCDYIHNWSLRFEEENNQEFLKNLLELNQDLDLLKEYEAKLNSNTSLDILFIMDCTGSMGSWIEQCKQELNKIIELLLHDFPGTLIKGGFVAYRDIGDKDRIEVKDFTEDIASLKSFIGSLSATGGADTCEDLAGGLEAGLNLTWTGKAKYAILITDAPNHGLKYHKDLGKDDYPKGLPGAKPLSKLIKEYALKQIDFNVIRINNSTDLMFKKISKYYKACTGVKIQIGDLRESKKDFGFFVAGTASGTLSKVTLVRDAKELMKQLRERKNNSEIKKEINNVVSPNSVSMKKMEMIPKKPTFKSVAHPPNKKFLKTTGGPLPYEDEEDSSEGENILNEEEYHNYSALKLFMDIPEYQKTKYEAITHTVYIVNDRNCRINWRKPLIQSHKVKTSLVMVNGFFGEGAMRYAYRLLDLRDNSLMVAKLPKDANSRKYSLEIMIKDVESQLICQTLVHIFNDRLITSIPEIDSLYNYANCLIYEMTSESDYNKFYWGENFIEGHYEKYNNNAGWENSKGSKSSLMAQCLSHFSWQYTKGYLIIVDVQGCSNVLTDPQIHCVDEEKFGQGNLGYMGIIKFFMSHRCNKYCEALGLLHPKSYGKLPEKFSFFLDDLRKPKTNFDICKICELCNYEFRLKSFAYFERKKEFYEVYCNQCIKKINDKVISRNCKSCEKEYVSSEYWFFVKKMEIPELCVGCRKQERELIRKKLEGEKSSE